jgi:hypothetical protein
MSSKHISPIYWWIKISHESWGLWMSYEYIYKIWISEPETIHPRPYPPDARTEQLGACPPVLMVQHHHPNWRAHYRPDPARKHTTTGAVRRVIQKKLWQSESTVQELWNQSKDGPKVAEAHRRQRTFPQIRGRWFSASKTRRW